MTAVRSRRGKRWISSHSEIVMWLVPKNSSHPPNIEQPHSMLLCVNRPHPRFLDLALLCCGCVDSNIQKLICVVHLLSHAASGKFTWHLAIHSFDMFDVIIIHEWMFQPKTESCTEPFIPPTIRVCGNKVRLNITILKPSTNWKHIF
jgi:hypothetical protein